jgi:hypothetical protein
MKAYRMLATNTGELCLIGREPSLFRDLLTPK